MSHRFYSQMWEDSHQTLKDIFAEEIPQMNARPEKDRMVFLQMIATLYIRYLQIYRKLETTYDQMVHPQKRRVVRQVLDGVMGRLVELKNEMVQAEFSEYQYIDDVLQDFKLTPQDMEVPIPKYFLQEREQLLAERKKILGELLLKVALKTTTQESSRMFMSLEEAVRLIQINERARQGRLRAKFMHDIEEDEKRKRKARAFIITDLQKERACILIQKIWRGFTQRRKTKQDREKEMVFIGMVQDPQLQESSPVLLQSRETEEMRRTMREEEEAEYQMALTNVKETLQKMEGPDMKDNMKQQIRQWFIECHDYSGRFPDYPEAIDGGSQIIFANKTPQQVKEEMQRMEEAKQAKKEKKKKEGKAKKKGKQKEKKEEVQGLILNPSKFLPDVAEGDKTFKKIWRTRDESKNLNQTFDAELIKEEKRKEVEQEIRVQVDELMREELQKLKMAVDRDMGIARKGKGKGKKRGKKGKKGKKEKDLTPDRTLESLYEELVMQGLLKQAQDVNLNEYEGDYSYLGSTLRMSDVEPMPSVIDLRQNIALTAILPLGSAVVHERAPLVKSILLAGPPGTGKRMLVHSICTEAGANLFDLSPENTFGKYPGKSGLQMMLHMVFKVAKIMQPSVVWIGDAEKVFYKKVPKEEKGLDPKRLKKDLLKVLKNIKAEDRVLLVGTSQKPYLADIKSFCKFFQKIFLIPRPDYASRYVTWKRLIQKHAGILTNKLNLSSLAKMSDGYCQGPIAEAVKTVLRGMRVSQQSKKPLSAGEFLLPLARYDPIYREEEETLQDWYKKTPLGKKRQKAAEGTLDTTSKGKGKKKGAGKKKGR